MNRHHHHRIGAGLLLLLGVLPGLLPGLDHGVEAGETAAPLAGFRAQYAMSVGWFPLGRAEFLLAPGAVAGEWEATVDASMFGMRNRERSRFDWNDCQPRTHRYVHTFKGLGIRRESRMAFDWADEPTVTNVGRKGEKTYAIRPDTLDEITLLLSARCVFAAGASSWSTTTAYGSRMRTHDLRHAGTEMLEGPDGEPLETVRIEKVHKESSDRRTTIWVAPELDWMLLRAKHSEGGLSGTIELRRLEPLAPQVVDAVATGGRIAAEG